MVKARQKKEKAWTVTEKLALSWIRKHAGNCEGVVSQGLPLLKSPKGERRLTPETASSRRTGHGRKKGLEDAKLLTSGCGRKAVTRRNLPSGAGCRGLPP